MKNWTTGKSGWMGTALIEVEVDIDDHISKASNEILLLEARGRGVELKDIFENLSKEEHIELISSRLSITEVEKFENFM